MSSLLSKALVYLGLVDEDQPAYDVEPHEPSRRPSRPEPVYEERRSRPPARIEGVSSVEGRRVDPPTRPMMSGQQTVRAVRPVEVQSDVLVVEEFGDAKILADRVRDKVPVVLDLRRAEPALVRRVVDFSSGLIYALDGTMRKVGEGLVLVLPPRVTLSRDEKRRLAGLGVYQVDDAD
ncbi:MAG TPA: cell division protein SepF [Acidimicrobiia bacterium]|jgi:cell division inhibitor SepF|nr:cell division protein SepF [Acidimicrobiia bacterium]